ncbi:epithelial membrane protein 1 [Tachyglossus aculeatus]|uniref:epithelial membrane protein 1 n=1 Tax=Tachyglossus aculeatus TaxID=9261 RepID=UPI0018F5103B|nr:epithelial membrane protein 1 [Tachyglossus aculeatus]XP_038623905.1 epithelial membrane protein 1 [Tachyglossus aculeatus]
MLVLLAGIFVIHIATVVMLFVSTIANVWMVTDVKNSSVGLWKYCENGVCTQLNVSDTSSLKTVQAFMILAIIFSSLALFIFIFQLFTLEKGNRFFISGAVMLLCWIFILIAVSVYTNRLTDYFKPEKSHHGYSFILAWICFCFAFLTGVVYLVLRKK